MTRQHPICTVSGCNEVLLLKGFCKTHLSNRTKKNLRKKYSSGYVERRLKTIKLLQKEIEAYDEWRVLFPIQPRSNKRTRNAQTTPQPLNIFSASARRARTNGKSWTLTEEEFLGLRTLSCQYCQFPLPASGGLDRIDNSKGYAPENVVPCCTVCNKTRGDWYSYDEMLELGPILRALKLKRNKTPVPAENSVPEKE